MTLCLEQAAALVPTIACETDKTEEFIARFHGFARLIGYIAVMVVIFAVAFVLAPQGRLWNARLLPFYSAGSCTPVLRLIQRRNLIGFSVRVTAASHPISTRSSQR